MNILIITPFYKHDKNIASVRWTNISKRLAKSHNVIVVTQPFDDMDMKFEKYKDEDNILVARINQKTDYEKFAINHFSAATGDAWQNVGEDGGKTFSEDNVDSDNVKRKLKNKILYSSMEKKAKEYASFICKNVIPKDMQIDVVISSACPIIEMMFGYELKKKLSCKWICDFRDLPFIEDNCDSTHRMRNYMQKQLSKADAITVVVQKMKEDLLKSLTLDEHKISILTNGFSMDEYRKTSTIQDDALHIIHTGALYGGERKADLLFMAITEVLKTHPDYKFSLDCAGGNNETLIQTAEKYGLKDIVNDKGFLPREEALDLQSSADCLLVLVHDMFAAKLFEYILFKKPIISITCGNRERSEATKFVEELNLGIATEEVTQKEDVTRLADFLAIQYERKITGKPLLYEPNEEKVAQYDHDCITQKLEQMCLDIQK